MTALRPLTPGGKRRCLIVLTADEAATVEAAAGRGRLPLATWARVTLLRAAGTGDAAAGKPRQRPATRGVPCATLCKHTACLNARLAALR